jgi:hypothetical protein
MLHIGLFRRVETRSSRECDAPAKKGIERMRTRGRWLCIGIALIGGSTTARASCNVIPAVGRVYRSTIGGIVERLAGPNDYVHIVKCPSDEFNNTPEKFTVQIWFGSTMRAAQAFKLQDCGSTTCPRMEVHLPDTDPAAGPESEQFAGPATILVTEGTKKLAQIDKLYEPIESLSGCDKTADDVTFGTFTVLPRPNRLSDIATQGADLRMAEDGLGDILIPIEHPVAGSGLAQTEYGQGKFCAKKPGFFGCSRKVEDELSASTGGDLVRAFTKEGERIAPLLIRDDDGHFFGFADGDRSVLRVRKIPGIELAYLKKHDQGPIIVTKRAEVVGDKCEQAKLVSARVTPSLVANLDKDGLLYVRKFRKAGRQCKAPATTATPGTVDLGAGALEPIVAVNGELVAISDSATKLVRAWDVQNEVTPNTTDKADAALEVNAFPIAVEDNQVFFRTPSDATATYFEASGNLNRFGRADVVSVAGGHVARIDGDTKSVWTRDLPSSIDTNTSVTARDVVAGSDLLAAIDATDNLVAWPWSSSEPGAKATSTLQASRIAITEGCASPDNCESRIVVKSPGSGGTELRLAYVDSGGALVSDVVNKAAIDFVAGERLVAFRDASDSDRMHVVGFEEDSQGAVITHVKTTGVVALGAASGWHKFGWRKPYVVMGDDVLFLTSKDGKERLVIYHYRSDTKTSAPVGDGGFSLADFFGDGLAVLVGDLALGDEDRDGVIDSCDNCPHTSNPRQLDDDFDGLGDGDCDETACSDLVPVISAQPDRLAPTEVFDAAQAYLRERLKATRQCLKGLRAAQSTAADSKCRGSFAGNAENRPLDPVTADKIGEFEAPFREALRRGKTLTADLSENVDRIVRVYGQTANAMTRIGETNDAQLTEMLRVIQSCVHQVDASADVAGCCLGRLEKGVFTSAGCPPNAQAITLPEHPSEEQCLTWRNAVRAAMNLIAGPQIDSTSHGARCDPDVDGRWPRTASARQER